MALGAFEYGIPQGNPLLVKADVAEKQTLMTGEMAFEGLTYHHTYRKYLVVQRRWSFYFSLVFLFLFYDFRACHLGILSP